MSSEKGFIAEERRKFIREVWSGVVLISFAAVFSALANSNQPPWLLLAAALLFGGFMARRSLRGVHCPKCGGNIMPLVMHHGWPFVKDENYRFCPCCGAELG